MKNDLFISIWNNNHFSFLILGVEAKNQIWLIIKYEPDMQHLNAIADEPNSCLYFKTAKKSQIINPFQNKSRKFCSR